MVFLYFLDGKSHPSEDMPFKISVVEFYLKFLEIEPGSQSTPPNRGHMK